MNLYKYHINPSVLVSGKKGTKSFELKQEGSERAKYRQFAIDIKAGRKQMPFEIAPKSTERELEWDDAFDYCKSLGDNWRLPTKDELELMYSTQTAEQQYEPSWYWSSTSKEDEWHYAWRQLFTNGNQYTGIKSTYNYCRAIKNL